MYPVLFSFGSITVYTYGVIVAVGFFFSVLFLMRSVERASLNLHFLADHFFSLFLFSLVGARLLYVLIFWEEFSHNLTGVLYFWEGGFMKVGGIIAFLLLFRFYAQRNQEDFGKWFNIIFLSAVLWNFFESIGSFLAGVDFGVQTSLPWGVQFDNPAMPFAGIPVHPTQMYGAIFLLVLFFWFWYRWKYHLKDTYSVYLAGAIYFSFHFVIEFLYGDYMPTLLGVRATQFISLLIAIFFVIIYGLNRSARRLNE